jgi:hypothetical protein
VSSFDHRKTDLRAQLAGWKTLMKPWEWDPVVRAVESYLTLRDEALTALIAVVADDGTERLRSKFESTLDDYASRISAALGGMLTGLDNPSEGARLFREQAMVQEAGFFNSIDAPDACGTRDMLVVLEADFLKLTSDLDSKWEALKGNSRRVLDTELEATRAMNRLFDDTIKTISPMPDKVRLALAAMLTYAAGIGDDFNKSIVDTFREYNDRNPGSDINEKSGKDIATVSNLGAATFAMAKTLGISAAAIAKALPFLIRDPGMIVSDTLTGALPATGQDAVTALGEMRKGLVQLLIGPYVARKQTIQDALPFQGTLIVSFSDVRTDVSNFMSKNGVEAARKLKDQSDDAFDHWIDGQRVPGNHDDAVDIKVAMQGALQKRFDRMLSALERFVSANSGVFLGTPDSRTRNLLLDQEEWDRQMSGLEGMALDERLRVWNDSVITIDASLNDIWSKLQDQLAGLPVDLQYPLMQRVKAVWDPLVASIRDAANGARSDIDQSTRTAGADQRRRDLDRSAVAAKLPQ